MGLNPLEELDYFVFQFGITNEKYFLTFEEIDLTKEP